MFEVGTFVSQMYVDEDGDRYHDSETFTVIDTAAASADHSDDYLEIYKLMPHCWSVNISFWHVDSEECYLVEAARQADCRTCQKGE